jgi:hypothetical protein
MHPGLASMQLVYSGFGNYIAGEWPTIGHLYQKHPRNDGTSENT